MNQDTLNKIETIAGYLKPLYDDLDVIKQRTAWHFMPGLIEEVEEWLAELAAPQQSTGGGDE